MSDRVARVALGVVTGLVLLAAVAIDLPRASDGRFWSDGATYHAMTGSLAFDGDLEFSAADLARVRASYPGGPQGVFLKRVGVDSGTPRLVYAKALVYPVVAAPLARLFGVDRGLLLLNALVFVARPVARLRGAVPLVGGGVAAAGALAVLAGGVVPVYLLWQTPEIFNLGLATFGLLAFRRGRWVLAAVLLGLAAYSKPTNLALALPLLLEPSDAGRRGREAGRSASSSRLVAAAVVAAVVAAGFAVTWVATGEMNYQGGERKTFYDRYPFDPGVTFDSGGVWMTTDHLGPLVAGRDEARAERACRAASRPRGAAAVLRPQPRATSGSAVSAAPCRTSPGSRRRLALFLLVGPRERHGWLALTALGVSWLGYILLIPDNWYGGGGTIGNRYFVNLVPLGLLLLPRGRGAWAAAAAVAGGLLLAPILASPVHHSLRPGEHATRAAFRLLPAEITMLGDLSVFTDVWRKRRPYNAPDRRPRAAATGDATALLPVVPRRRDLRPGGVVRRRKASGSGPATSAEVVLQALSPRLARAPRRDRRPRGRHRDRPARVRAPPAGPRPAQDAGDRLRSPCPALGYYGTSLYPLRLGSRYGEPTPDDPRTLGSFVQVVVGRCRRLREDRRPGGARSLERSSKPREEQGGGGAAQERRRLRLAFLVLGGFHPPNPPDLRRPPLYEVVVRSSVLSAAARRARG